MSRVTSSKRSRFSGLDAIQHGSLSTECWQSIAAAGLRLWLDAGIPNSSIARRVIDTIGQAAISVDLVVGLESLESEKELAAICDVCRTGPPIFSLDMQEGQPLVRNRAWRGLSPVELVFMAQSVGICQVIVLDLADVGTNLGTRTLDLCQSITQMTAIQTVIAGGGVRGVDDLGALAEAGAGAALVASALHDGRLTREEIRGVREL